MKPRHRNKRLAKVALIALPVGAGIALLLAALNANTLYFHNPSEVVVEGFTPRSAEFRIGGDVEPGSLTHLNDLNVTFRMVDFEEVGAPGKPVTVTYTGVLPTLFGEGEGVVVRGSLTNPGQFLASEVLAKHDENYRPKMPAKTQPN